MRRIVLTAIAAALIALPIAAADGYSFHFKVTDGKTGLLANPDFEKLHMPQQQVENAAKDRVAVFDHAAGAHWKWIMLTWPDKAVEQGINSRGAAKIGGDADFAFSPGANGKVHLRCLRTRCRFNETTLMKGEAKDLATDADFKMTFE